MQKLAAEFGLSDVGLAKICKRHKIPRPSRGHWAKIERGKKADEWPLLPVNDESLSCIRLRKSEPGTEHKAQPQVAEDPEIDRLIAAELAPDHQIQVLTDLRGADHLITATWENACRIKTFIEAVRMEAIRRFGRIDDESDVGRWLQWAEQYLQLVDPLSADRELPTYSLSPQELEQLRRECESDWCSWSHSFRPRQPR